MIKVYTKFEEEWLDSISFMKEFDLFLDTLKLELNIQPQAFGNSLTLKHGELKIFCERIRSSAPTLILVGGRAVKKYLEGQRINEYVGNAYDTIYKFDEILEYVKYEIRLYVKEGLSYKTTIKDLDELFSVSQSRFFVISDPYLNYLRSLGITVEHPDYRTIIENYVILMKPDAYHSIEYSIALNNIVMIEINANVVTSFMMTGSY